MLGHVAALLVRLYQLTLGRILPSRCKYAPTCSQYAVDAFRLNGLLKGFMQVTWRILRCNPWSLGGWDPAKELPAGPIRRARRVFTHG